MTKDQFARARSNPDQGVLVHLVCNEADAHFYSDDPDCLCDAHCAVLTVETFFSAICDGGVAAWFDLDHGQLAHRTPGALRIVGLPEYAALADEILRCHHQEALPATVAEWAPHLDRIRTRHGEEDCSELYELLDTRFFDLLERRPTEFRERLYDYILAHEADFVESTKA